MGAVYSTLFLFYFWIQVFLSIPFYLFIFLFDVTVFLTLAKSSWTTFLCQFRCENIVVAMMKFAIAFPEQYSRTSFTFARPLEYSAFAIRPGTATIWRKAFIFVRFKKCMRNKFQLPTEMGRETKTFPIKN